ncbi:MAG: transposase, partial [Polyangiales bacterium]
MGDGSTDMKARKSKRHSQELKESVARRYIQTDVTYLELADEIGATKSTVYGWVQQFREQGSVGRRSKKTETTEGRSAEEKLRLVLQAAAVPEEERGAFLRREGIHDD